MPDKWMLELQTRLGRDQVLFNEPMAKHTTFRVGGPAEVLVRPGSRQEIATAIEVCQQMGQPWMVIGSGSNLLVRSGGIKGVVIDLGSNFHDITLNDQTIIATSGVRLSSLSRYAAQHGLSGLEFAEGIPGSLGGAVFMNAGAYEGEISQVVTKVISFDPRTGQEVSRSGADLDFSYRHSCFQQNGELVLEATISLIPGKREEIMAKMQKLSRRRREKQPLDFPSAGSTFKRPPGHYVGPLLEELGLRGYSIGDAQVSKKHCGFIINRGGASADDVLALIKYVQEQVFAAKGIWLETEVRIVGEP